MGSGTSIFEAENLGRNFYGIDIQRELVELVRDKVDISQENIICGDSTNPHTFIGIKDKVQFVILHPPYADIIHFSDDKNDLSNAAGLEEFRSKFNAVLQNSVNVLESNRYLAIIIGDKYAKGEWIPLGFYLMEDTKNYGLKLKSVIIKNMSGNRAKQNKEAIWQYRALSSDYYIFKHEYIFVFKKEKNK
jgi:DNA modification methylase